MQKPSYAEKPRPRTCCGITIAIRLSSESADHTTPNQRLVRAICPALASGGRLLSDSISATRALSSEGAERKHAEPNPKTEQHPNTKLIEGNLRTKAVERDRSGECNNGHDPKLARRRKSKPIEKRLGDPHAISDRWRARTAKYLPMLAAESRKNTMANATCSTYCRCTCELIVEVIWSCPKPIGM